MVIESQSGSQLAEIVRRFETNDAEQIWTAAVEAGELIASRPDEVWELILDYGSRENADMRQAISSCMLEHLLEHNFERYFGRLEESINSGNKNLGQTFSLCWKFGQSNAESNALRWDRLATSISSDY
jgi:hypothetical protein